MPCTTAPAYWESLPASCAVLLYNPRAFIFSPLLYKSHQFLPSLKSSSIPVKYSSLGKRLSCYKVCSLGRKQFTTALSWTEGIKFLRTLLRITALCIFAAFSDAVHPKYAGSIVAECLRPVYCAMSARAKEPKVVKIIQGPPLRCHSQPESLWDKRHKPNQHLVTVSKPICWCLYIMVVYWCVDCVIVLLQHHCTVPV